MYKHIVTLCIAAFLLTFGVQAPHAQEASVLRWSDIEAAIDRHPTMKRATAQTDAAQAEIGVSRQYPNPEIGASIGQGRANDGSESGLVWGIELEIPIDAPGAYLNETEAAQAGHQAARAEVLVRRLQVERDLKTLFLSIAFGQERLQLKEENVARLTKLVDIARLRVTQGEARPMEATRLEIELEKEKLERASVKRELDAQRDSLNLWMGGKLPAEYSISFAWKELPTLPERNHMFEHTQRNHPELRSAALHIKAAAAHTRAERHELFPNMSIGGFYDRELDAYNYGGMLSIELPLWNWNRGGIAKARAEERIARHEREVIERELRSTTLLAYAKAEEAILRARRFADSILPKARQAAEEFAAMYRVGETGLVDLLDTRRERNQLETDMLAAFEAGWLAHLELITLLGGDHE